MRTWILAAALLSSAAARADELKPLRLGLLLVDGAAVLDAIAIPVAFAEMMVTVRRRAGLRTGRRWHTPLAPPTLIDRLLG